MLSVNFTRFVLHFSMMLLVLATPLASAGMDNPRSVWIEVQLRTPTGPALEADVPVTIVACRGASWVTKTDANGFARVQVTILPACSWVSVGIWRKDFTTKDAFGQALNLGRFADLEKRWCEPAHLRWTV
jgi:hypothetical protein